MLPLAGYRVERLSSLDTPTLLRASLHDAVGSDHQVRNPAFLRASTGLTRRAEQQEMVSSNLWIAGVVVPPVTLLVGVVWSVWWYRRAKRLLGHRVGLPQTTQVHPQLVSNIYEGWSHGIDLVASPLATPLASPFPRLASAPSPSPSPPPSPPPSSIHTSINRKGSRVLSKRKRPSSTGPPSRRASSTGTAGVLADYPMPDRKSVV